MTSHMFLPAVLVLGIFGNGYAADSSSIGSSLETISPHDNAGGIDETGEHSLNEQESSDGGDDLQNFLITGLPNSAELDQITKTLERFKLHVFDPTKDSFEKAQTQLATLIQETVNEIESVVSLLNISRFLDLEYDTCANRTNTEKQAYDDCLELEAADLAKKHEACNESAGASPGWYNISMRYRMVEFNGKTNAIQCNFSTFKLVQHPTESCTDFVRHISYLARTTWHEQESHYKSLARVCTNATSEWNQTQKNCKAKWDAYTNTKQACMATHGRLNMARCTFEHQLKAKCESLSSFDELAAKVKEQEVIRKKKYQQMRYSSCLLSRYTTMVNGSHYCLDKSAQAECAFNVTGAYEDEVGIMDYFSETRESVTTEPKMTCKPFASVVLGLNGDTTGYTGPNADGYFVSFVEDFLAQADGTVPNATGVDLCGQPGSRLGKLARE